MMIRCSDPDCVLTDVGWLFGDVACTCLSHAWMQSLCVAWRGRVLQCAALLWRLLWLAAVPSVARGSKGRSMKYGVAVAGEDSDMNSL